MIRYCRVMEASTIKMPDSFAVPQPWSAVVCANAELENWSEWYLLPQAVSAATLRGNGRVYEEWFPR